MEKKQAAPSRAELEQHLRARAWKDEAFRQEFLAHPKVVLERDYAAWFPKGSIHSEHSIKVIEEDEQTLCFVLPPKEPDDLSWADELDEEEVSAVMGGIYTARCTPACTNTCSCTCTCTCISICRNNAGGDIIRGVGKMKL